MVRGLEMDGDFSVRELKTISVGDDANFDTTTNNKLSVMTESAACASMITWLSL